MIAIGIVFFGALALLFAGINKEEKSLKTLSASILGLAGLAIFAESKNLISTDALFSWVPAGMIAFNPTAQVIAAVLTVMAMIVINLMPAVNRKGMDVIGLMMFSVCGGLLMIGAQHLVVLFLGIEILSIPLFVLAGSEKDDLYGNEASLKYFLMGAFSTAIFLLGAAFLYGGTGTLYFHEMLLRTSFSEHFGEFPILVKAGLILVSVGLLFKVSAVPFHFWSPDVYEGSPNRIAAFMAIIVKIAGFASFAQLLSAFAPMQNWYSTWLLPISIITVLGGNIVALVQNSYKRMLAYSSVSHAGYLLLFLLQPIQENFQVLGVYLLSYGLGTAVLFYLFDKYATGEDKSVNIFTGIVYTNRLDAVAMIIATFTVAGIPSTIGFIAKYQLFSSAFNTATWGVLLALVGSAISISYYFKPFRVMFRTESDVQPSIQFSWKNICLVGVLSAMVLLGILPMTLNWIF